VLQIEARLSPQAMSGTVRCTSRVLAALVLGSPIGACGAAESTIRSGRAHTLHGSGTSPAHGSGTSPAPAGTTKRSGELTVTLTATPTRARVGATIQVEVTASARHAVGALGYQLRYGDGTGAANIVPQFCIAGSGAPRRDAWRLTHRYEAPGHYRVSASVYVNCARDRATATVAVTVA
jgi:PKD domain